MGNTLTEGKGRYERTLVKCVCQSANCNEKFEAAKGRNAKYCSPACKQEEYRYRRWDRQQKGA